MYAIRSYYDEQKVFIEVHRVKLGVAAAATEQVEDLHGLTILQVALAAARDAARWPHTMLATSTHDHKRSGDVRLRLDVSYNFV